MGYEAYKPAKPKYKQAGAASPSKKKSAAKKTATKKEG